MDYEMDHFFNMFINGKPGYTFNLEMEFSIEPISLYILMICPEYFYR